LPYAISRFHAAIAARKMPRARSEARAPPYYYYAIIFADIFTLTL
jgi:hypothetical protein